MEAMTPHQQNYHNLLKQSEKSRWEEALAQQMRAAGIAFEAQFRFHAERMWRLDFAIPEKKIGIEIQGGTFGRVVTCHRCHSQVMRFLKDGRTVPVREGGYHNTGKGIEADAEKANALAFLGWRLLIFTSKHIKDHYAIQLIRQIIS